MRLYQTTDIKVIFGNKDWAITATQADRIQYTQAGETREAKILDVKTHVATNLSCTASSRGPNGCTKIPDLIPDFSEGVGKAMRQASVKIMNDLAQAGPAYR